MTTDATRPTIAERALSERVRSVPPSGIRRFFDILATMDDVISLGVGEPDFDTPEHIVQAGIDSLRRGRTHYTSNYGTIELRQALADHLERLYGVAYDPATEILITVGASEAVDLALRATCDPGDEVILHEPSYVAYVPAITFAGGVVRHVATRMEDDFALDPAAVEAAITPRTKALFLGYPCNPTGAVLPEAVQDELARIAVRHDLLVYSDEIYDRLGYGSYRHRAMSALPGMRERTILMGGFSKAYAMTGWRVGWLCAPAGILEGIVKVHQYGIMSAPTTAQDAGLRALTDGERDVREMLAEYDRRRRLVVDGFNAIGLPTFEPRGAFYAFPGSARRASTRRRSPSACSPRNGWPSCPAMRSGRPEPATSGPATRRPTSSSRRLSCGSVASWSVAEPDPGGGEPATRRGSASLSASGPHCVRN